MVRLLFLLLLLIIWQNSQSIHLILTFYFKLRFIIKSSIKKKSLLVFYFFPVSLSVNYAFHFCFGLSCWIYLYSCPYYSATLCFTICKIVDYKCWEFHIVILEFGSFIMFLRRLPFGTGACCGAMWHNRARPLSWVLRKVGLLPFLISNSSRLDSGPSISMLPLCSLRLLTPLPSDGPQLCQHLCPPPWLNMLDPDSHCMAALSLLFSIALHWASAETWGCPAWCLSFKF